MYVSIYWFQYQCFSARRPLHRERPTRKLLCHLVVGQLSKSSFVSVVVLLDKVIAFVTMMARSGSRLLECERALAEEI